MPARAPDPHAANRAARRLALAAVFEADFGQRTAAAALERQISDLGADDESAAYARSLVEAVVRHRDSIDARIEASAPAYPVVQLARIDRALLRSALGELLHSAATPARVVIAEWVGLARTYSGEPARRLLNGVLGRIADETGLAAPVRGAGDRESRRSRSGGTGPP
ncbi:MAG: transcription antitermination factor NusB [Candidatus Limnocylindrales bacterium]